MIGNTIKTNSKEASASDELTSSDLLVLDYDDEAPTCVDMRSRGPSPSYSTIIPPANHDERDVYILTKRAAHSPKKPNNERVNFNDVMGSSLPAWSLEMPEEVEETPGAKLSSLLPVAIPNDAPAAMPTAPTTNPRALYAALIGSLSAAAIAFALWTPNSNASVPQAARASEAQSSVVDLPLVEVEGTVEVATIEASKPSKPVAVAQALVPQAAVPAVIAPAAVEKKASEVLPVPTPSEEEVGPFDKTAASAGLNSASNSASGCRESGDPSATVSITVTFAANGRVTNAVVDGPPFGGTKTGGCIAKLFRAVRVSPFSGSAVTVHKTFQLH